VYCFDTDVLSALLRPAPPLSLVRRLARTDASEQCTTSITLGELLYGAARIGSDELADRIAEIVPAAHAVLPFDETAARTFARLKATLERAGAPLAEPDFRIAAIALARDLTLVTGNVRHFERVPQLRVENWLE
jgi:tRNA(fMet)-specific endonuclease VapC